MGYGGTLFLSASQSGLRSGEKVLDMGGRKRKNLHTSHRGGSQKISQPGAMIGDEEIAISREIRMVKEGKATAITRE